IEGDYWCKLGGLCHFPVWTLGGGSTFPTLAYANVERADQGRCILHSGLSTRYSR
ncbi:6592_t:CDS:1, partial [Acaulospora colombiana]